MTALFNQGDAVTLTNTFRVSGAATDPTTITLQVIDPAGSVSTYTYADNTINKDSTGTYSKIITADSVGIWRYVWTGTGTAIDIADGAFTVYAAADRTLYCSPEELKVYLGSPAAGTGYDTQLIMAAAAASRSVDAYCNRRFWLDPTPVARTFAPRFLNELEFDDLGSTTGLVVATDAAGDGTFETVWASSDYELTPVNAAYGSPEARPWTGVRAVGSKTVPWLVNTWLTRLDRVQVTGRWGWPGIPAMVRQATLIKAAQLFHRRNSPQGVAAFDEFNGAAVRISRFEDPTVVGLLDPYRLQPVLVA